MRKAQMGDRVRVITDGFDSETGNEGGCHFFKKGDIGKVTSRDMSFHKLEVYEVLVVGREVPTKQLLEPTDFEVIS